MVSRPGSIALKNWNNWNTKWNSTSPVWAGRQNTIKVKVTGGGGQRTAESARAKVRVLQGCSRHFACWFSGGQRMEPPLAMRVFSENQPKPWQKKGTEKRPPQQCPLLLSPQFWWTIIRCPPQSPWDFTLFPKLRDSVGGHSGYPRSLSYSQGSG